MNARVGGVRNEGRSVRTRFHLRQGPADRESETPFARTLPRAGMDYRKGIRGLRIRRDSGPDRIPGDDAGRHEAQVRRRGLLVHWAGSAVKGSSLRFLKCLYVC